LLRWLSESASFSEKKAVDGTAQKAAKKKGQVAGDCGDISTAHGLIESESTK
jgi:hypothetical protein